MNTTIARLTGRAALVLGSVSSFGAQGHITEALQHVEAASKAADGRAVIEHAEAAAKHAQTSDEHLQAAIKSLEAAIQHGKLATPTLRTNQPGRLQPTSMLRKETRAD
jgi:hypothetical protein